MAGTLRRFDSENPGTVDETVIQDHDVAATVVHHFDPEFTDIPTSELGTAEHNLGKIPTLTLALEPEVAQGTEELTLASLIEPRKRLTPAGRPRKNSGAGEIVRSRMKQTFFLSSGIVLGIAACLSALCLYKSQSLNSISISDLKQQISLPTFSKSEIVSSLPILFQKSRDMEDSAEVAQIQVDTRDETVEEIKVQPPLTDESSAASLAEQAQVPSEIVLSETDQRLTANEIAPLQLEVSVVDSEISNMQSEQTAALNEVKSEQPKNIVTQAANSEGYLESKPVAIAERRFLYFQNSYRTFGSSFEEAPVAIEKIDQDQLAVPDLKELKNSNRLLDSNSGIEWQSGWEIDKPEKNLKLGEKYIQYLKSKGAESSKLEFQTIKGKPSQFLKGVKTSPSTSGSISRSH